MASTKPWRGGPAPRLNARMRRLLQTSRLEPAEVSASASLLGLLEAPLVETGGVLVLAPLASRVPDGLAASADRTSSECVANHVALDEWLEPPAAGPDALLSLGLAAAARLRDRLSEADESARVILAFDGESCTLRFHRRREGEEWLADDLDDYPLDAILVLDTDGEAGAAASARRRGAGAFASIRG